MVRTPLAFLKALIFFHGTKARIISSISVMLYQNIRDVEQIERGYALKEKGLENFQAFEMEVPTSIARFNMQKALAGTHLFG